MQLTIRNLAQAQFGENPVFSHLSQRSQMLEALSVGTSNLTKCISQDGGHVTCQGLDTTGRFDKADCDLIQESHGDRRTMECYSVIEDQFILQRLP